MRVTKIITSIENQVKRYFTFFGEVIVPSKRQRLFPPKSRTKWILFSRVTMCLPVELASMQLPMNKLLKTIVYEVNP